MYERYYGLDERPFDLSPNPRFLFLSKGHNEALAHLRYGLLGRPGLTVLLGEAGTGKTTLVRTALQVSNGSAENVVHLSNPTLTRAEFFEYLTEKYGFPEDAASSKPRFLRALECAISERARDNEVLALIVDESQSLPHEVLEEIRLLTNLETPGGQSLAVALVGQPEFAARLDEANLRQLKQRVTLRCELEPLDVRDTAAYIAFRVRTAGGRAEQLFTREAVIAIHQHSGGIPRTISVICDNALVTGFAADVKPVGRDIVLEVCREFHVVNQPNAPDANTVDLSGSPSASVTPFPAPSEQPQIFSRMNRPKRFSFFGK